MALQLLAGFIMVFLATTPAGTTQEVIITIGKELHPVNGHQCVNHSWGDVICPSNVHRGNRRNTDWPKAKATFNITTTAKQVCAERADAPGQRWGQNLQFLCSSSKAYPECKKGSMLLMREWFADCLDICPRSCAIMNEIAPLAVIGKYQDALNVLCKKREETLCLVASRICTRWMIPKANEMMGDILPTTLEEVDEKCQPKTAATATVAAATGTTGTTGKTEEAVSRSRRVAYSCLPLPLAAAWTAFTLSVSSLRLER